MEPEGTVISITIKLGGDGSERTYRGRCAWALRALIDAGPRGITSLTNPAPRLSHYVFKLRRGGIPVQTVDERHVGPYSGVHGRYLLDADVTVLAEVRK